MRTELTIRLTALGGDDIAGRMWWRVELPYGDPAERGLGGTWGDIDYVRWPLAFQVRARTARGAKIALAQAIKYALDGNEDEGLEPLTGFAAAAAYDHEDGKETAE